MSARVYLSSLGTAVEPSAAKVSVFDRGFLYGDSVYETVRTAGPWVLDLERHLVRLHRSADGIGLEIPFRDDEIRKALLDTIQACGNETSRARIVITRGAGPMLLDTRASTDPLLVIYVQPLELPAREVYEHGMAAVIADPSDVAQPGLKTGNYLSNILALRQAIEQAGDDAIMCNRSGLITEGATSNVFAVIKGEVVTPALGAGLLAGITREVILELCEADSIPNREDDLRPEQLRRSDELFLTSSVRGVMPVTRLDGQLVGDGRVGPMSRRVMRAYDDYVRRMGRGERPTSS